MQRLQSQNKVRKSKNVLLLLLLVCLFRCYAGSVKPLLNQPEFKAENEPVRTLRILLVTDNSYRNDEIETFLSKCSNLIEVQVGVRLEIVHWLQIRWDNEQSDINKMMIRVAADTWSLRDTFDIAVALVYFHHRVEGAKMRLGGIDTIFWRYIFVKELDPNVLLHEIFHAFLLREDHPSEDWVMRAERSPHGIEWYWLTPGERKEVLRNKWRDFNVIPATGQDKERAKTQSWFYYNIGLAHLQKEEYDLALLDSTKYIELNPDSSPGYKIRGYTYASKRQYDQAIADFTKALEIDPKDADAFNDRGIVYKTKGQQDQAIADFSKALEIDPNHAKAYYNRGDTYNNKDLYAQAIADYSKALEIDPKYVAAYNSLAWLLATTKEPRFRDGKKAVQAATKACELSDWEDPDHLDTLAAAYARVGDFDSAVKWQQKALDITPRDRKTDFQGRLDLYRSHKPWPPD